MQPDSLLVSINSVQSSIMKVCETTLPDHCHYVGCHPLFGFATRAPDGMAAVLVNYEEKEAQKRKFFKLLTRGGLLPSVLSAEEHDQFMSVVQALTHFCLLAFGKALLESGLSVEKLLKVRTPNFNFLYAFCSRVLLITPSTTAAIQQQHLAPGMREVFLKCAAELHEAFLSASTEKEAAACIERLRAPLRGADVEEGARVAAVAVDALQRFEIVLQRHRRSERPFVFRHKRRQDVRAARILEVLPDEIVLQDVRLPTQRGNKTAVLYNEEARKNYAEMGIIFPSRLAVYRLKKKHVELVSTEELQAFHTESVLPVSTEHSFSNEALRDQQFLESRLPELVPGLIRSTFLNQFSSRGEMPRVALSLEFRPDRSRVDVLNLIAVILKGGGSQSFEPAPSIGP